jgi:putative CocE/NonD family hydrolase
MLFDRLRAHGVPARLVTGPWNHLQASAGTGLGEAGYGGLEQLQLRWFDRWVMGRRDAGLLRDIAPVTYYEQGSGTWRRSTAVVRPGSRAVDFRLSGSATPAAPGGLSRGAAGSGTAQVPPLPVSGLCTRSTDQWTAGLPSQVLAGLPCFSDNGPNDRSGVAFDTAPLTRPVRLQGPINARLFTSSSTGSGMLAVSVEDVAPDGTVHRLTAGWQVVDQRALDRSRSRYLDGRLIQPFHPFTAASAEPLSGTKPVDVEVFPTAAVIRPGHRLRLAVQAFDVPHLAPTLPEVAGAATVLTLHTGRRTPSVLTIPVVR